MKTIEFLFNSLGIEDGRIFRKNQEAKNEIEDENDMILNMKLRVASNYSIERYFL